MSRTRSLLALAALFGSLAVAAPAAAEPTIIPYFGQGFADEGRVRSLVGSLTFAMESCDRNPDKFEYQDSRSVSVTLGRRPENFEGRGDVVDGVLRQAAQFAWRDCPHPRYFIDILTDDFYYNIDHVVIRGPNGDELISAMLGSRGMDVHGDSSTGSSRHGYTWVRVQDLYAQARQAEAEARAREARAAAAAQERAVKLERDQRAAATFWTWVRLLLLTALALWAWFNRVALIRNYYRFTPHPATGAVHSAIYAGEPLDGKAFEKLVETPGVGPIEASVRAEQARELAELWLRREAELVAQTDQLLKEEHARAKQEGDVLDAQRALIEAAIAHEKAAARLAALRPAEKIDE